MPKGRTNNPDGRPPGKPNKVTQELRERIKLFLDNSWPTVQKDFKKLKPVERVAIYEKLLKYVVPVQKESLIDLNIEGMTEEQLNTLLNKLITNETSTGIEEGK